MKNPVHSPAAQMGFAALAVASMAAVAHELRAEVPWQVLAFWRIFFTFVVSLVMARIFRARLVLIGPPVMWLRSTSGAFGLLCMFYTFTHMPITDALAIQQTNPLWVAVLLALYYRRAPGPMTWLSVVLGIAGVMLLERPTFDASGFAMLVALMGAWSLAIATMSLRFLGGYSAITVVAHYCGFSTLIAGGAWVLASGEVVAVVSPSQAGMIALIGIFGTLGQLLMTHAMGRGDTQLLTLIALASIGFAAFYDFAFWGLAINWVEALGIAAIVASVIVCSLRPREIPLPRVAPVAAPEN